MAQIWKKEVARDLMALGSIPFLILVLARITMLGNFKILFHISVAILLLSAIYLKVKVNYHAAVIVILIIFTSLFYESYFYLAFASAVGVAALYAMEKYLKHKRVVQGALVGVFCSIISYLLELPLQIPNL